MDDATIARDARQRALAAAEARLATATHGAVVDPGEQCNAVAPPSSQRDEATQPEESSSTQSPPSQRQSGLLDPIRAPLEDPDMIEAVAAANAADAAELHAAEITRSANHLAGSIDDVFRSNVSMLESMGFAKLVVQAALTLTNGDVQQAMELCLDPSFGDAEAAAALAADRLQAAGQLQVTVHFKEGWGDSTYGYTLNRDAPFRSLFRAVCERVGWETRALRFLHDGEELDEDDTPLGLGLLDAVAVIAEPVRAPRPPPSSGAASGPGVDRGSFRASRDASAPAAASSIGVDRAAEAVRLLALGGEVAWLERYADVQRGVQAGMASKLKAARAAEGEARQARQADQAAAELQSDELRKRVETAEAARAKERTAEKKREASLEKQLREQSAAAQKLRARELEMEAQLKEAAAAAAAAEREAARKLAEREKAATKQRGRERKEEADAAAMALERVHQEAARAAEEEKRLRSVLGERLAAARREAEQARDDAAEARRAAGASAAEKHELARLQGEPTALQELPLEELEQLELRMQQALSRVQSARAAQVERQRELLERRRSEEEERRRRQTECVVCMEANIQVVFVPCGHIVCCAVCAEQQQSCPTCRADIVQRVRTFLAHD